MGGLMCCRAARPNERHESAPSTVAVVDAEVAAEALAQVRSNMTQADFEGMVERAKEDIRAGEAFQIVVSQRFEIPCAADSLDVYRMLRSTNPSPYMYLFRLPHPDGGHIDIVGSSPEAHVKVTGREAILHPIAGTRPRGKSPEHDLDLMADLLADPKERAEHIMLVDLGRNDLQRVSEPGTVDVVEFMDAVAIATSSTWVDGGRAAHRGGIRDVLAATFPRTPSGHRSQAMALQMNTNQPGDFYGVVGYRLPW